jgi:hypothetical protein
MMIKKFNEWSSSTGLSPLNEDAKSSTLKAVANATGRSADDLVRSGFKGVGSIVKKLFGASTDDVSKMEKGLSDVINAQKQTWWQSLSKDARKSLEKEGDDIVKKYVSGYHAGSEKEINAARQASKGYLKKLEQIATEQKAKDKLVDQIEDLPTRKMKNQYSDILDDAQKSIDDAAKTGDPEKLAAARNFGQKADDFFTGAGKKSVYASSTKRYYGRSGILGRGMEPGANLAEDATNALGSKGKDGLIKTLTKEATDEGKKNLKNPRGADGEKGGMWEGFKRNLKRLLVISATIYGGGVAWNYLKNDQQNKAVDTVKSFLEDAKERFANEGITLTKIDMNDASFADSFKLFFAGDGEDLPVDDAKELDAMLKAGSTMTDFFAKTAQLCFEYPERYFKENEDVMEKSSLFYGFVNKLNEKIGIAKLIDAVRQADGMASKSIEETFYEDGAPVSLDEHGYASFSNPNMKILLGSNEPVKIDDLIDESKEFIKMFSTFKRKVMNDFIQNDVTEALKENGEIVQEEFEERSRRIGKDLEEQLSEKEEAFVAMTGLLLSYNYDRKPFKSFYGFDDSDLYTATETINDMIDENFDLRSTKQLSRMYLSLSSEFSDVYAEMGKGRTLYGVMEHSIFGFVMRSMMTMFALEKVCRIIASTKDGESEETFTRAEIEDYQKMLNQIQRTEGTTPTVTVSGELDDETVDALKQYQAKLGLPETGRPGGKSLVKLKDYLVSIMTSKTD